MACDFFQLATPGVQGLQPYQPGKPIEELEREYGIKNAIKLASNENPLGPSPRVLQALEKALTGITRYPDGNGFILKQALAKKWGVDLDNITLGNGSNDILELIARAFVTSNHSVIFSEYAFAVYPIVTQALGATALIVPAQHWGHDLTAMQAAVREDTKVIFIANPNNPTGTWLDKENLQNFIQQIPEEVIIVLDEAYFEYARENPAYPNSLEWLPKHPNLIICRTFSKAFGLAGLRVGYSISTPQITNLLNRVRQPFNVNNLALVAATAALQDEDYLTKGLAINREGMSELTAGFQELGVNYINSIGNFILIDVQQPAEKIYRKLLAEGIIVRPVGTYNLPQHLRISVGLEEENFLFLEALRKVLKFMS